MDLQQTDIKISVIIPCYNVADYIEGCIRSILNQTYTDYEIILIDDCGNDDSIEKAERLLKDAFAVYTIVRHDANRGLSAGRNSGMEIARGEYILFVDSDDTIEPNCLQLMISCAESTAADIIVGDINVIGNSDTIPLLSKKLYGKHIVGRDNILNSYIAKEWYVMAWNKLIKRDFLVKNKISFVEGLVHEDNPWTFEIACTADSIAFLKEKTYNYLVRENSLQTGKNFKKHFDAYMTIIRLLNRIILEKNVVTETSAWYECQKALFFSMTLKDGTQSQCHEMYKLIHSILPIYKFKKQTLHYLLPSTLGYNIYKRFFGMNLCM